MKVGIIKYIALFLSITCVSIFASISHDWADRIENVRCTIYDVRFTNCDSGISYSHDRNGNLNSALPHTNNIPVPHSETTYTYDYENRLIRYLPLSNESAAEYTYTYDGLGNRTRRTKNGETRNHILDRGAELKNVLAETDTHGKIERIYIWGPNGLLAQINIEDEGGIYFFHANELGSTLSVTDESGEVIDEICYTPYGEICNRRSGFDTPYLYIGGHGIYYETLNLYHIKARYYDSVLKRFISKDPIGLEGGYNLYTYTKNCPVFYIDKNGLYQTTFGGAYYGGGVISYGKNKGRRNFKVKLGLGFGFQFIHDKSNKSRFDVNNKYAIRHAIFAQGGLGYRGLAGIGGNLNVSFEADSENNYSLGTEVGGNVSLYPYTGSGSIEIDVRGNFDHLIDALRPPISPLYMDKHGGYYADPFYKKAIAVPIVEGNKDISKGIDNLIMIGYEFGFSWDVSNAPAK